MGISNYILLPEKEDLLCCLGQSCHSAILMHAELHVILGKDWGFLSVSSHKILYHHGNCILSIHTNHAGSKNDLALGNIKNTKLHRKPGRYQQSLFILPHALKRMHSILYKTLILCRISRSSRNKTQYLPSGRAWRIALELIAKYSGFRISCLR